VGAAAIGTGLPGSSWGAEVGFCAKVGTTALDLRLEPNPRPLKREFIEFIELVGRGSRGGKEYVLIQIQCVRRGWIWAGLGGNRPGAAPWPKSSRL
jgi:hypothetical protein